MSCNDLRSNGISQDAFVHDKGQTSAISRCCLHSICLISSSGFFLFLQLAGASRKISGRRESRIILSHLWLSWCFCPELGEFSARTLKNEHQTFPLHKPFEGLLRFRRVGASLGFYTILSQIFFLSFSWLPSSRETECSNRFFSQIFYPQIFTQIVGPQILAQSFAQIFCWFFFDVLALKR